MLLLYVSYIYIPVFRCVIITKIVFRHRLCVGTAIVAGSHVEYGLWALLVIAATMMPNCKFRKSKMPDSRHFKIVKAPYLNEKLSDFDDVWRAEANSDKDDSQNFPNSRRLTSAIFKLMFEP